LNKFSHTDERGKAKMVDVTGKIRQIRIAKAEGFIYVSRDTLKLISENEIKKGDVLSIAQIAGIQAVKKTSELIPLCHPLEISNISIKCQLSAPSGKGKSYVKVLSEVKSVGQTGVEMEALTGVNVALLTIYDMCKAVDKEMLIGNIKLIEKKKFDTA
jgi:cyclic pyranopterin monophosphate synthase